MDSGDLQVAEGQTSDAQQTLVDELRWTIVVYNARTLKVIVDIFHDE